MLATLTSKAPVRHRTNELIQLFLSHTLLVTDIHPTLLLASRTNRIRLIEWLEGKDPYDSVTFYENGKKIRLSVCPDAFFEIEDSSKPSPPNQLAFVLEADRSSTTCRTFDDKIKGYHRYLEQNRQRKFFNVDWFLVVTITLTKARAVCPFWPVRHCRRNSRSFFSFLRKRTFHSKSQMRSTIRFLPHQTAIPHLP